MCLAYNLYWFRYLKVNTPRVFGKLALFQNPVRSIVSAKRVSSLSSLCWPAQEMDDVAGATQYTPLRTTDCACVMSERVQCACGRPAHPGHCTYKLLTLFIGYTADVYIILLFQRVVSVRLVHVLRYFLLGMFPPPPPLGCILTCSMVVEKTNG